MSISGRGAARLVRGGGLLDRLLRRTVHISSCRLRAMLPASALLLTACSYAAAGDDYRPTTQISPVPIGTVSHPVGTVSHPVGTVSHPAGSSASTPGVRALPASSTTGGQQPADPEIGQQIADNVSRMQTLDEKKITPGMSDEDVEKVFKDFKVVHSASSDSDLRNRAIQNLPYRKMTSKNQQRCQQVVKNISLYRHMPTVTFEAHPQAYLYCISHPDVCVAIWRSLGVTKMNLWQTGPNEYECDDKAGTEALVDFVYRSQTQQIVYYEGDFASPFMNKTIHASGLFILNSEYKPAADGRIFVTHTADCFVSFPSHAVEAAAKLISPVSNMIADRNFREVSLFVHTMSRAMQKQPTWVEQVAEKMEGVLPQRKEELVKLATHVYLDERKRNEPVRLK